MTPQNLIPWLLLIPLCGVGCSSAVVDETPPPSGLIALALGADALTAESPLGQPSDPWPGEASTPSHDAEGSFARKALRPLRPQRVVDPTSDAALARLLDQRPVLRGPARLACIELRGAREYVAVDCFGDQDYDQEASPFWARTVPPAQLGVLRGALQRSALPTPPQGWPEVEAVPTHAPFASILSVPSMLLPRSGSLRELRLAAARVRCEVVLILTRSTRVYRYHNGLANLYPFVIGLALPAREEVAVSRVEAALVGVRSGHVFAVATGEARCEESGWLLLRGREDSRAMADRAEEDATYAMSRDLSREIAQLESEGRLLGPSTKAPRR